MPHCYPKTFPLRSATRSECARNYTSCECNLLFASVSPPWISLDYSVKSFIFLKLHAMFLKKFIASTCQSLTRKLFSTPRACRKPDVGVVRTTTNRRPSMLSCFELMSSNLPNNKANQPITQTQSCLKANLPSHCALTHSGHKYKPNKPSHCTRWPLRQMTRCGHKANKPSHSARYKPNKPSHCTRWPLRQMTRCTKVTSLPQSVSKLHCN